MKNIVLIGGGGHCKSVLDSLLQLRGYKVIGILDPKLKKGSRIFGVPVIGKDKDMARVRRKTAPCCMITVGSVGFYKLREKLFIKAVKAGFTLPAIVSPSAVVSKHALINSGVFIAPGAVINAGSVIGCNTIINTGAVIDHDCVIGNNVHIAPGAVLSGGVKIGPLTHIGAGSVLLQYVKIGSNTVIGAGSVVTRDVKGGVIAYGAPCKAVRKNNGQK